MAPRHHASGRYTAKGRPPRTEIKSGKRGGPQASAANAAFNEHATRANAPGAVATAGQIVGAGVKLS